MTEILITSLPQDIQDAYKRWADEGDIQKIIQESERRFVVFFRRAKDIWTFDGQAWNFQVAYT